MSEISNDRGLRPLFIWPGSFLDIDELGLFFNTDYALLAIRVEFLPFSKLHVICRKRTAVVM